MVWRSGQLNPQKIMVRATNWVGDVVLSLPALTALRARFPRAKIVVVAKPWVSELYWYHAAVSKLVVYDSAGEHKGWGGFRKLVQSLRAENFDTAVLFQNAFQAAWMAWRARIPVRIGYARDVRSGLLTDAAEVPAQAAYGHQVNYYLQLLFRTGLIEEPAPVEEIRLAVTETEKKWAERRLGTLGLGGPRVLVGLNPGAAYGPAKRWLPERYAALADRLENELHAHVLIFGSREERPLAEKIAQTMKHRPAILAGETTLRQLMALLAQCRLVVSNDSGPMHLAAALGVPLVAVFGSTDERVTGPVGRCVKIVKRPVACSPCGLRECPIDFRCMTGVTVEDVLQSALDLVAKTEVPA